MTPSKLAALAAKAGLPRFIRDSLGNFRGLLMGGKKLALPYVLAQSAVPVILAPAGTVAVDGTLTLATALQTVYSGGAWVRLPAGAVAGGAAGMYWAVFSSTTVGALKTAFVDPAAPFVPFSPAGPVVAAVGSGIAYAQTTGSDITLANVTLPGGALGPYGQLRVTALYSQNSSAGAKTGTLRIGGALAHTRARTTALAESFYGAIRNRGVANRQVTSLNNYATEPNSSGPSPLFTLTVDTAVDQSLVLSGQVAAAGDYIVLDAFEFEVRPS